MKLSERAMKANGTGGHQRPAAKPRKNRKAEPIACPSCGCLVDRTPDDGSAFSRNTAHHRLFFAEVAAVTRNWRNLEVFDPAGSCDAMRGWLLTEAGHCYVADVRLPEKDARDPDKLSAFMSAAITAITKAKRYGRIAERNGFFCVLIAHSIAFANCGEVEFRRVHARVHDILEREGFDIEALRREASAATIRNKHS